MVAAGEAAAAWTTSFTDDGRSQWAQLYKLVGPSCNTIARSGTTLRVTSCGLSVSGSKTAMLWPRKKVAGKVRVEFDFTQHSAVPVTDGSMSALLILASGDGTAGYPVDVTTWGVQCCATPVTPNGYAPHMYGLQINFAYKNDPRGNATIRVRGLKGAAGSYEELGQSPPLFEFVDGRRYRVTANRNGSTIRVYVQDTVTLVKKSFSVVHPYIGSLGEGWIGFRQMQARSSSIGNVSIAVDN